MSPKGVIRVNVGGTTFLVSGEDLDRFPDSTLACAHRFSPEVETLDFRGRDASLFTVVMDLFRYGKLVIPEGVKYSLLKEELDFWGFELITPIVRGIDSYTYIPNVSFNTRLACPWGVSGKELGQHCWMPLACFFWNSLLASPCLIESVAVGYRDVNVYVKHSVQEDRVGISLLLSHKHFLQRLAELSGCRLSFIDGVYGGSLKSEARLQDVLCENNSTIGRWSYVHHQDIAVSCRRRRNEVYVTTRTPTVVHLEWRGFDVEIDIDGNSLFWSCCITGQGSTPTEDPLYLQDTRGFFLRISYVIDRTVYEGFCMPSLTSRYQQFKFPVYASQTYSLASTDDGEWYKKLAELAPADGVQYLSEAALQALDTLTLLIEDASSTAVELSRVRHDTPVMSGCYYERFNISL